MYTEKQMQTAIPSFDLNLNNQPFSKMMPGPRLSALHGINVDKLEDWDVERSTVGQEIVQPR